VFYSIRDKRSPGAGRTLLYLSEHGQGALRFGPDGMSALDTAEALALLECWHVQAEAHPERVELLAPLVEVVA
jgi:hypothetical protein